MAKQDPKIKALIERIDNDPDRLHADVTPAVLELMELGFPAARAVLDLLNAPEFLTRKRAQRVLEGVVMRHFGWKPGRGYADDEGQEKTAALLKANNNYQADTAPAKRKKAIEQWRRWLESQSK